MKQFRQLAKDSMIVNEVVGAFLKRWGTTRWKQQVWDSEYEKGKWQRKSSASHSHRDSVFDVIEKYSTGGEILELGCGTGETAFETKEWYSHYEGVDISDVAVRTALLARDELHPSQAGKISFVIADMSTFSPVRPFAVILFRESVYYIPSPKISATLRRLSPFLTSNGVFIVRVHDRAKYKGILDVIQRDYNLVEQLFPERARGATIVFRPRAD